MLVLITKIKTKNCWFTLFWFEKARNVWKTHLGWAPEGLKGDTQIGAWKRAESSAVKWFGLLHVPVPSASPSPPSITWSSFLRRCCSTPSMPRSPCSQCTALGSAAGPRTAQQGSAHLPGTAGRPLSVTTHLHVTSSSHCCVVNSRDRTWPWICTTWTSYSREERATSSFLWHLKVHSRNATFSTLVITTQE